ncbi:hypothetical protein [Algibacter marinivivus]|uniref:hypothetical protein n=1 Tax=Algibacter marinivivus TaxID=2100723 RepID=UPI0011B28F79|nr:hypothetical protein [Algibacter marinivivus]
MNYINNRLLLLSSKVEKATNVPTTNLAYYRVFFGLLLLLYFTPSWTWISDIPPAFFSPRIFSFAYLGDGYLPPYTYKAADISAIILIAMITLGIRTRLALIAMFILNSVFFSYSYSFGKIDHNTTFLIFTYLLLAFTNSGSEIALLKDKKISTEMQNISIAIIAIMICFGFFSAGISKFFRWIDFDLSTSGFLFWFNLEYFIGNSKMFLADKIFYMPIIVIECMDYCAAIFEVSALFFLLKGKKSWFIFLIISCVFHLSTLIFINIDFTLNVLTYGIFLFTPFFKNYSLPIKKHKIFKKILIYFVLLFTFIKIFLIVKTNQASITYDLGLTTETKNYINLFLWLFTILISFYILKKPIKFGLIKKNDTK